MNSEIIIPKLTLAQVIAKKKEVQNLVLKRWRDVKYNGTAILPTGAGKTRIIVLAAGSYLRKFPDGKVIITVPSEKLRDEEIPNEFRKWGYEEELKKITVECIQSAYKRSGETWDLWCGDEIHTVLTPEYSKFYTENKIEMKLLLSATVEGADKIAKINDIAPIFYNLSVISARKMGIISDYIILNLGVKFDADEQKEYDEVQRIYSYYEMQLGGNWEAFKVAKFYLSYTPTPASFAVWKTIPNDKLDKTNMEYEDYLVYVASRRKAATIFLNAVRARKRICASAKAKQDVTVELLKYFDDRYVITFDEYVKYVESLSKKINHDLGAGTSLPYHASVSILSDKARKENMRAFLNKEVRVLCTAKAVDVGVDIPHVSLGLCLNGDSKSLRDIQRRGRTTRVDSGDLDKVAVYVNIYVADSQEEKWLRKRTKGDYPVYVKSVNELIEFVEEYHITKNENAGERTITAEKYSIN